MDSAAIIEKLTSRDIDKRSAWQISRLSEPPALPALIAALKQTTPPAPGLITTIGGYPFSSAAEAEEACEAIENALAAKGAPVLECVEALARIAHPRSVPVFSRLLLENWQSPNVTARLLAIVALARIGSDAALPPLLHALAGRVSGSGVFDTCTWNQLAQRTEEPLPVYGGGEVIVPTLAAWALGRIGSPDAVTPLVEALKKRAMEKEFQQVAMFALTDVTAGYIDHLRPLLQTLLARVRYAVFLALARKAPLAHLDDFRAALADSDEWVRFAAARGLAAAASNEGVPALRALLDKWMTDPKLKPAIYAEVAQRQLRELLPDAFDTATTSKDKDLRAAAAQAANSIVSVMTAEELVAAARPEGWLKKNVSTRLESALASGLVRPSPALVGLLRAAEDTIAPVLTELFDKNVPVVRGRPAVAGLLVASGLARDPKPWIRRLDDKNAHVAELAFVVLTGTGDPACQPRLLEILQHVPETGALGKLFRVDKTKRPEHVRRKVLACVALARCGDEAALRPLLQWIGDANISVRAAAGAALVEVGRRHLSASLAAGVPEALVALWSINSFTLRAALARYFGEAGYVAAAPVLSRELEEAYGTGPFANYRDVLATALSRMPGVSVPPAPSHAREAELLARDIRDKPEEDSRFRELAKFETLLTYSMLDSDNPDPVHRAIEVYPSSMPPCCSVCLGDTNRTTMGSFSETVSTGGGVKTVTHFMAVPICPRCRALDVDGSGPFTAMSWAEQDGIWNASFANPRYGTMAVDNAWLATSTESARRIFLGGLADAVERAPAAADSEAAV